MGANEDLSRYNSVYFTSSAFHHITSSSFLCLRCLSFFFFFWSLRSFFLVRRSKKENRMSATEPLTHVEMHGRHFFIPRSLTDPSRRLTDGSDGKDTALTTEVAQHDICEADRPTAEERQVLHELLTAVVLSATCRCGDESRSSVEGTGFSDESDGVTNLSSHRTLSATTVMELEGLPPPSLSSYTQAPSSMPTEPLCPPVLPPCNCTNAQTVACAVAVILLSCALLRTTCD